MFSERSMIDHDPQIDLERYWREETDRVHAVRKNGAAEYVRAHVPDIAQAFQLKDRACRCIDEGTPGGIHLAGAGCLLSSAEALATVKEAAVSGIYSHAGCGAAARAAKEQGIPPDGVEQFAQDHARALAEAAQVPYLGHIQKKELKRPPEAHVARVVYYDGTGRFDPSQVKELPKGFVVSRRYLRGDYAAEEVTVSAGIATGDHGFGRRITNEEPFMVIVVGDPSDPAYTVEALTKEVEGVAQHYGGRVVVDGFVAPEQHEALAREAA